MEWSKVFFLSAIIMFGLSQVATNDFNSMRLWIIGIALTIGYIIHGIMEITQSKPKAKKQ